AREADRDRHPAPQLSPPERRSGNRFLEEVHSSVPGSARALRRTAGGTPPEVTGLLEQVRADHTPIDVIVVDERHRLPVGRPYLTAIGPAGDRAGRCLPLASRVLWSALW